MEPALDAAVAWEVRAEVYRQIVETSEMPAVAEVAAALGLPSETVRASFYWLDGRHALYLEPGTDRIRIANPFSGVPTAYRVHAGDHAYWANCIWDALGIPAALGRDARIEATPPGETVPVELTVASGELRSHGEVAHFLLPFALWYDDLVFT